MGLSVFSACNSPASPSPEAQGRTSPPTVGIELSPGTVVSRPATLDSLEQAQELVSFPVLVPGHQKTDLTFSANEPRMSAYRLSMHVQLKNPRHWVLLKLDTEWRRGCTTALPTPRR